MEKNECINEKRVGKMYIQYDTFKLFFLFTREVKKGSHQRFRKYYFVFEKVTVSTMK